MTLGYRCYLVFETLLEAPQSQIANRKSAMRKMGRSEIRFVTGAGGPPCALIWKRTQTCILLSKRVLSAIEGPICQTSLENEPKTRKTQIQGEIRPKKRPNCGSKTNPNEPIFGPVFGEGKAQNQTTNPNEPKKRTQEALSIQRAFRTANLDL
jgi:hypothetical protein